MTASQTVMRIDAKCSSLDYHVSFPRDFETYKLNIYTEGPCGDKGISNLNVSIYVDSCKCPPGFMMAGRITKLSAFVIIDLNYSLGTSKNVMTRVDRW